MELSKEGQSFLDDAHEQMKQLKDCDFEEFKANMISLGEQLLASQLMMMEILTTGKQEIQDVAVESIQAVRDQNDKDFLLAEENFNKIRVELDRFHDNLKKCEAGNILAVLKINAMLIAFVKKGLIDIKDMETVDKFRGIPKKTYKFLANFFGVTQKSIKSAVRAGVASAQEG
jgi:hypothetical protein